MIFIDGVFNRMGWSLFDVGTWMEWLSGQVGISDGFCEWDGMGWDEWAFPFVLGLCEFMMHA